MKPRNVVVICLQSDEETVLVQNNKGDRRDPQFPGGGMSADTDPLIAAKAKLCAETGLSIDCDKFKLERVVRRKLRGVSQTIHFVKVHVPQSALLGLREGVSISHRVSRVATKRLPYLLSREDLSLLS